MQTMRLIHGNRAKKLEAHSRPAENAPPQVQVEEHTVVEFPLRQTSPALWNDSFCPGRKGEFFKGLSASALSDFESHAVRFICPGSTVLLREEQKPTSILFLIEGTVELSMNSFAGKRFILGIAGAGEILGLHSAISGNNSEIQAEARYPCRIESLQRQDFLEFLMRYPVASKNVAQELTVHYARACQRLRILGFASTVQAKLARLLLEWCNRGQQTESGTQIRCLLTHEEIGECIGASRETVTRALNDFKNQELVELRGASLIIRSRRALANYAGLA